MLCRYCYICHGTVWAPPGQNKVTSICHIFTLSASLHWNVYRAWEGEGWLFYVSGKRSYLIPVKEIEQFKVPQSSSVSNTIEHYFVREESTSAWKAQLSAAVIITILCSVSKIFWPWKSICSLAKYYCPLLGEYHLGRTRMYLTC